jgi:hypothetical protein
MLHRDAPSRIGAGVRLGVSTVNVVDAIGPVVLTALAGGVGIWYGHLLGATEARRDRLRGLYAEIMAPAIGLTPKSLGYKMSDDAQIPEPHVIDAFVARLMVENERDDDAVRTAFVGVFNFAMLYGIEKADVNTPAAELQKTRKLVDDNLTALQRAMRARLK